MRTHWRLHRSLLLLRLKPVLVYGYTLACASLTLASTQLLQTMYAFVLCVWEHHAWKDYTACIEESRWGTVCVNWACFDLCVCSIWQWLPESLYVSVCTCMDDHCVHSSITKHISRLHACKIELVLDKISMHSSITVTFESLNARKCEYCFNIYFCVHWGMARSALRISSAL